MKSTTYVNLGKITVLRGLAEEIRNFREWIVALGGGH
jgi:hypothetical protein